MFERLSEWISATSFAIRRVRLDDMAKVLRVNFEVCWHFAGEFMEGSSELYSRFRCPLSRISSAREHQETLPTKPETVFRC